MTDRWIKPKWPEVTDNYQLEVFESKNDFVQQFGNGMVLGVTLMVTSMTVLHALGV